MSEAQQDTFAVAGREFHSRLLVGTGKYRDMEETRLAIEASGAEIVTIAVRRTNIGQVSDEPNILEVLPPDKYTILPNTAGCYDAATAIRTCRLARELLDGHNLVKLEVLGDEKTLFPDVMATLEAAETLVGQAERLLAAQAYERAGELALDSNQNEIVVLARLGLGWLFPCRVKGEVIGVLGVGRKDGLDPLNSEEVDTLKTLAAQAARSTRMPSPSTSTLTSTSPERRFKRSANFVA